MADKKPTELMRLLQQLVNEPDDSKIQEIYNNIASETLNTKFKNIGQNHFVGIIIIKYIQVAVKQYVYSHRSEESKKEIVDLVDIIKDFEIL